jgi:ferredoxin-NADP reductase
MIKVVMRVSKNPEKLSKITEAIEFTREYFNKRVLTEAAEKGLSRIWICGPPKLNSDIGKILLENGYSRESFLFL